MATMSAKDRNRLPDSAFGIPSKRAYPLYKLDGDKLVPDKAHIESAVRLFGHASRDDKPLLAKNILRAAHEAGMETSGWNEVNKWANHNGATKKKAEEKAVAEAALSFDVEMAIADLVLEYNEMLYDEFYEAAYADDETFMEQFEEPDDVQEAVPGLWEDYIRKYVPTYDPKTHTVQDKPREVLYRDPNTGELFDIFDPRFMDDDIDLTAAQVVKPATRKPASWPKATSKEMNRRNAFLKRHKFDPNTGSIEIDEIDPATGQKMRIPAIYALGGRNQNDMGMSEVQFGSGPEIPLSPEMRMMLGGTGLTQKASITEPTLGHETGHIHQRNQLRRLSRQFPHHRVVDDLMAAGERAKTKGDIDTWQRYKKQADKYYSDNIDAIRAETDKIRKHIIPGSQRYLSPEAMDIMHQQNPEYQRAVRNSQSNSQFLNSHDIRADELHADDYGDELASKYTRGRRTGAESLKTLETPEQRVAKVKKLRGDIEKGQKRTIEKTSSPMSRYHDALDEIARNRKMRKLDFYETMLENPEDGDYLETAKAKIAELKSDPEVQELLAKREKLSEEYRQVPLDQRQYVDRREHVPAPDPRYADVDLSTVSDDELIDRFDPTIRTTEKRIEIARQVAAEKAARDMANQAYRRQLSKETLQSQIDSGQLTPQQEKKARQKIASIDAFERKAQSAVDGTPITDTKKKKKTSESKKPKDSKEQPKKQETKQTEKKSEPEKKQEPAKKPAQKKDELPVQPATKKDSMTISDQKEPKK